MLGWPEVARLAWNPIDEQTGLFSDYEQENWLLDPEQYWVGQGKLSWQDSANFQERHGPRWINNSSSYNGQNDRIVLAQATALRSSLKPFMSRTWN